MVDMTSFRRWVGEQPDDRTYDYGHRGTDPARELCAMGQFLKERYPRSRVVVEVGYGEVDYRTVIDIPPDVERALKGDGYRRTQTFGGLKKRLAELA